METPTPAWAHRHPLDSTGNPPLAKGSMVHVPDLEGFVESGDWTESSGTAWSSADVMALDMRVTACSAMATP